MTRAGSTSCRPAERDDVVGVAVAVRQALQPVQVVADPLARAVRPGPAAGLTPPRQSGSSSRTRARRRPAGAALRRCAAPPGWACRRTRRGRTVPPGWGRPAAAVPGRGGWRPPRRRSRARTGGVADLNPVGVAAQRAHRGREADAVQTGRDPLDVAPGAAGHGPPPRRPGHGQHPVVLQEREQVGGRVAQRGAWRARPHGRDQRRREVRREVREKRPAAQEIGERRAAAPRRTSAAPLAARWKRGTSASIRRYGAPPRGRPARGRPGRACPRTGRRSRRS